MTDNPFNPRPPIERVGCPDIEEFYCAIGAALVKWEWTENGFAHLFSTIINPSRPSSAARRAYGSAASSKTRFAMLKEAAAVYFDEFPKSKAGDVFNRASALYGHAIDRRNDIAHGVVTGGPSNHNGYYLAANLYTTKRMIRATSPYFYTPAQIVSFTRGFDQLAHLASATRQLIRLD